MPTPATRFLNRVTGLVTGLVLTMALSLACGGGGGSSSTPPNTPPANNADLSALTLSVGTLSPSFASAATVYTASVANATASVTVTPTKTYGGGSITVLGATVASGSASSPIALIVGVNPITVIVTSQDGSTQKTYTIAVTRGAVPSGGFVISRTTGVAPLAVFFDASRIQGLDGDDALSANFSWNFGDTAAGNWSTTGLSRNRAIGFLVAHVFETPGTYTVTMNVRDRVGNSLPAQTATITVTDPDVVFAGTNTRCVSQAGNFQGAPAGCQQITSSNLGDQIAWVNGTPNRRLLLRKGETWNGVSLSINGTGPGVIGAFGDGASPKLVMQVIPPQDPDFGVSGTDWRIMDLEMDGTNLPDHPALGSTVSGFSGSNNLGVRLNIHNAGSVGWGAGGNNIFLYESRVEDNRYFSVYIDGVNNAVMGCRIHQIRVAVSFSRPTETTNMYVAHNLIAASRANPTTGIKWHSRRGVVTDNVITAGNSRISQSESGDGWSHPVNQNLGFMLIERNTLKLGNPAFDANNNTAGVGLGNDNTVVRNNLIYDANSAFVCSEGDHATHVRIHNNSVYMTNTTPGGNVGNGDFLRVVYAPVNDWEIRNNIMHSLNPGTNGSGMLFEIISMAGLTLSNNLYYKPSKVNLFLVNGTTYYTFSQWQALGLDAHSLVADPKFLSVDPLNPAFLKLATDSPAIDTGADLQTVPFDFAGATRPVGTHWDRGAFEAGGTPAP